MKNTRAARAFCVAAVFALAVLGAVLAPGCTDPYTMYQTSGAQVATGRRILVMPFMDTRTYLAKRDPHREDVGQYVRGIFTDVLRERTAETGVVILTPDMPQPEQSLSTAEVAELGRRNGADLVVAGQVFSFNRTRAASIPPRAGMFLRVIDAETGALVFVGDHYEAAAVPVGGGDRDDQARIVAEKLVDGFLAERGEGLAAALRGTGVAASDSALANLTTAEVRNGIVPMKPDEIDELPEIGDEQVKATLASIDARAAISARLADLSGDELAEDLLSADGNIFNDDETTETAASAARATAATAEAPAEVETMVASAPFAPAASVSEVESAADVLKTEVLAAVTRTNALDNGPVVSEPMVFEQPRTYRLVDLPEDPSAARQEDDALVASPAASGGEDALRVLILPYHDRENPNNLIGRTGGGEVVTTLYGTQLALDPGITLMWDGTGMAAHDRLLSRGEAVEMGRLAGADYVMRGQVVEFRRAQSVPSFYSALLSTSVLAAQIFFAEMSGVDVATEVYRVEDGLCVMSRRDRSQQKYVVQAEKTVRRLAQGMAESVSRAIREAEPEEMDPLIDELQPVTVLSNP